MQTNFIQDFLDSTYHAKHVFGIHNGLVKNLTAFNQSWGSTALGFEGLGGQAFTDALTVVIQSMENSYVYFGGKFAYSVEGFGCPKFREDLQAQKLTSVKEAKSRYEQVP